MESHSEKHQNSLQNFHAVARRECDEIVDDIRSSISTSKITDTPDLCKNKTKQVKNNSHLEEGTIAAYK